MMRLCDECCKYVKDEENKSDCSFVLEFGAILQSTQHGGNINELGWILLCEIRKLSQIIYFVVHSKSFPR